MFSAQLVAARNSDKVSEWHDVRYGNLAEGGGRGVEYSYYTGLSTSKARQGDDDDDDYDDDVFDATTATGGRLPKHRALFLAVSSNRSTAGRNGPRALLRCKLRGYKLHCTTLNIRLLPPRGRSS
jgi:hypothetical protein